jgi:hypothetical protein
MELGELGDLAVVAGVLLDRSAPLSELLELEALAAVAAAAVGVSRGPFPLEEPAALVVAAVAAA